MHDTAELPELADGTRARPAPPQASPTYAGQLSASGLVKSMHATSLPSHHTSFRSAIEDARGIHVTSQAGQYM